MDSSCVICFNKFCDRDPPVATTCGHVYHTSCIREWFVEHDTCPACRCKAKEHVLLELPFNGSSQKTDEFVTLRRACACKDREIFFLTGKMKAVKDYANINEEKFAEDIRKYQEKTERLEAAVKLLSSVERKVNKLEHENRIMRNQLEGLKHVQLLITGSQKDVQDIIDKYDEEKDFKQLATISVLIKREMNRALESKSKLREEVATLSKEKGLINHELQLSKKKICDLEQQIKNLEDDTPKSKRIKTMDSSFQEREEVVLLNELIDCSTPDAPLEQPIQSNIGCASQSRPSTTNALSKDSSGACSRLQLWRSVSQSSNALPKDSSIASCPLHSRPSTSTSSAALPNDLLGASSLKNFTSIYMLPDLDIDRKPIPLIDITTPSASPSPSNEDNASSVFRKFLFSNASASKRDKNSSIQIGYDGFGGHSKTILPWKNAPRLNKKN